MLVQATNDVRFSFRLDPVSWSVCSLKHVDSKTIGTSVARIRMESFGGNSKIWITVAVIVICSLMGKCNRGYANSNILRCNRLSTNEDHTHKFVETWAAKSSITKSSRYLNTRPPTTQTWALFNTYCSHSYTSRGMRTDKNQTRRVSIASFRKSETEAWHTFRLANARDAYWTWRNDDSKGVQ